MSASIEQLLNTKGRDRCPGCGEPIAGSIIVQLRADQPDDRRSISRRVGLCDEHAAEVWQLLSTQVERVRAGDWK